MLGAHPNHFNWGQALFWEWHKHHVGYGFWVVITYPFFVEQRAGHRVRRDHPHIGNDAASRTSRRGHFDRDVGKGRGPADIGDLGAGEGVDSGPSFAARAPISSMDSHDATHDVGGDLSLAGQAPTIVEYRNDRAIQDSSRQSVVRMKHRALIACCMAWRCTRMLA